MKTKIFSCHHNFMEKKKKIILRCLEMNLCVCVRKFGWVGLGG